MTEPRTGPAQPADRLHLLPRHREKLASLLRQHLLGVEVWAYGSRVNGQSHDSSDLDLVLRGPDLQEIPTGRLADFREALRESTIPFLVEARDWARLPERFQREIEREYVMVAGKEERGGMGEWPKLRFSDAVLINPPVHLERGKSYPFVAMAAVHAGSRGAYAGEQRAYSGGGTRFRSGDTLMARITPCLENGKIARYCAPHSSDTAHGSTEFIVLRGRPAVTDSEFVYYLTHWEEVRHYAIGQMTGTSGRQRVPTPSLAHLTVTIPPLPEQRAIAYLLGTLDTKIEVNRRMNATLDEMARALFTSWFVHFDPVRAKAALTQRTSPGGSAWPVARARAYLDRLDAATAAVFPDRFVDSALGPIPAGWTVKPLDEIAVFRNGLALQQYRPQQDEDRLPVVKIAQLRSGTADSGEWATAKLAPDCVIDDGDIIFSWSGSLLVQVWCGGRAALNQHLFKVTSPRFPQWFLLHCLRGHLAAFQAIAAGKATTMGHIKRQHLSEALCAVPEERLLMAANGLLSAIFEKNISVAVQSRTLATLRDTLLPKLLSGDIRVRDAAEQVERLA